MTILKRGLSITETLLSVIVLMLSVIGWFFYGVVSDVKVMRTDFNTSITNNKVAHTELNGKLNNIITWTGLRSTDIDDNTTRSTDNATRLTLLDGIKPY